MQQLQPIVINFRGGIVSPGYLKDILELASDSHVSHASFGLHTMDFNPNSTDLVSFRKDVEKDQLGIYLVSLCKYFYEKRGTASLAPVTINENRIWQSSATLPLKQVYQCSHCLTVYDESVGEPENNIAGSTIFNELPGNYSCPLCEAGKEDFIRVMANALVTDACLFLNL